MNRLLALIFLIVIVLGCLAVYNSPSAMQLFEPGNSPVLFVTEDGAEITLAYALFAVVAFVAWFALGVLLSSIDPYLGYTYFRVTIELFVIHVLRQKDFKMPERKGDGSGKAYRVG